MRGQREEFLGEGGGETLLVEGPVKGTQSER